MFTAYDFGSNNGNGVFSKQTGNEQNQVNGHFSYPADNGEIVDVTYTAGVEGYIPNSVKHSSAYSSYESGVPSHTHFSKSNQNTANNDAAAPSSGAYSYSFNVGGTPTSQTYTQSNWNSYQPQTSQWDSTSPSSYDSSTVNHGDASYNFKYNTHDSSRQEVSDSNGNTNGHYSYTNDAGQHDLSYVAGSQTGFKVTGGSLFNKNDNSYRYQSKNVQNTAYTPEKSAWQSSSSAFNTDNDNAADASYEFSYNNGDAQRSESSNAEGTVTGHYSYVNEAGQHDISYEAGADKGFVITGGSLAAPNGINRAANVNSLKKSSWTLQPKGIENHGKFFNSIGGESQQNVQVTQLLPNGENKKYGYIIETTH